MSKFTTQNGDDESEPEQAGPYPWEPPEYDVLSTDPDDLEETASISMVSSNTRTNYIRAGPHGFHIDEPESMGHSYKQDIGGKHEAPTALDYLQAAAVGCKVNSLELLLRKSRIEDYAIDADSTAYSVQQDDVKRVQKLDVEIELTVPEADRKRAERSLDLYSKGCMVGESIARGIDIDVTETLVSDDAVIDQR